MRSKQEDLKQLNNRVCAEQMAKEKCVQARFESHIKKTRGCWIWTGGKLGSSKYGAFLLRYPKRIGAHIMAWIIKNGSTGGLCVLHKCDNPICVNPKHLFLGTQLDNIQDMDSKSRRGIYKPKGALNPNARLTDDKVLRIRQEWNKNPHNQKRLAQKFNVSQSLVSQIISGKRWIHVAIRQIFGHQERWIGNITTKPPKFIELK